MADLVPEGVELERFLLRAVDLYAPVALTLVLLLLRLVRASRSLLPSALEEFVNEEDILDDAEDGDPKAAASDQDDSEEASLLSSKHATDRNRSGRGTVTLIAIALLQVGLGVGYSTFRYADGSPISAICDRAGSAILWAYIAVSLALTLRKRAALVASIGVFAAQLLLLFGTALRIHYETILLPVVQQGPRPDLVEYLVPVISVALQLMAMRVMLLMPMVKSEGSQRDGDLSSSISPEDDCSLWEWVSFAWMNPVFARSEEKGTSTKNETFGEYHVR